MGPPEEIARDLQKVKRGGVFSRREREREIRDCSRKTKLLGLRESAKSVCRETERVKKFGRRGGFPVTPGPI